MTSHQRIGSSSRNILVGWYLYLWGGITGGVMLAPFVLSPYDSGTLLTTLGLGLAAAAVSVPCGILLAWVSCGRRWINRLMLVSILAMLPIPIFIQVSAWDAALGRLGWVTMIEGQVLVPLLSGWKAAGWIHGLSAAPQVAIILLVGFISGGQTLEEQGLLETSRWRVALYITFPRMFPLIIVGMLWTMIVCSREIAATDLYRVGTIAEQVYLGYSLGQFNALAGNWSAEDLVAAAQLNLLLAILMIAWFVATALMLVIPFFRSETDINDMSRFWKFQQEGARPKGVRQLKCGVAILLWTVLIIIPVSNLIVRASYFVRSIDGEPTPQYSLAQVGRVLLRASRDYTSEFFWSATIAIVASTLILVVSAVLAWKARRSRFWKGILIGSFVFSCAIPGPMMGTILIHLFGWVDHGWLRWLYDRTIAAPVLATAWFCFPIPPLVVWFLFKGIPRELIDSIRLEGGGGFRQFWRLGILDFWPQWLGIGMLTFCFCFGELSAAQLVIPPGIDTIPRLMLGLLHAGVDEMTAALTLILVGAMVVLAVGAWGVFVLLFPTAQQK